jgi:hypothetical protein
MISKPQLIPYDDNTGREVSDNKMSQQTFGFKAEDLKGRREMHRNEDL